ncbi:hypothetical protein CR513_59004, partial [Mucuna pruriens]
MVAALVTLEELGLLFSWNLGHMTLIACLNSTYALKMIEETIHYCHIHVFLLARLKPYCSTLNNLIHS